MKARKPAPKTKSERPRWLTEKRAARLGTVPDTRIANEAGVAVSTVRRWRRKLRIPRFCPGGLFT